MEDIEIEWVDPDDEAAMERKLSKHVVGLGKSFCSLVRIAIALTATKGLWVSKTTLARATHVDVRTVTMIADVLLRAGLIEEKTVGRSKLYRAKKPLSDLMELAEVWNRYFVEPKEEAMEKAGAF